MLLLVQIAAALCVSVLPGSWIAFPFGGALPLAGRLLLAGVLSPLVVPLQFYAVRLLGVGFEQTPWVLFLINLPALLLWWRGRGPLRAPGFPWAGVLLVLGIALGSLVLPCALFPEHRTYWGHTWMHTDTIAAIRAGALVPEDAMLAGVRLGYPWLGHVHQAVLSWLLDQAAADSFLYTNLLMVVLSAGFVLATLRELGAGPRAQAAALVLFFFGLNALGYSVLQTLSEDLFRKLPHLWGDWRYTPWLWTFRFLSQMPLVLPAIAAVLWLGVRVLASGVLDARSTALLLALLLQIGLLYPILLPAACAVVAAMALRRIHSARLVLVLGAVVLVTGAASFVHLQWVTADRAGTMLEFTGVRRMARKAIESGQAMLVYFLFVPLVLRRGIARQPAVGFLLLAGAITWALHITLHIPNRENEYKLVYVSCLCLAPIPGLLLEPWLVRRGRAWLPLTAAVCLLLTGPYWHKVKVGGRTPADTVPHVVTGSFDLRLAPGERFAAACERLRRDTPPDTVLLVDTAQVHFPTLTSRALFVPPDPQARIPGVNLSSDYLLAEVKGYPRATVVEPRFRAVRNLFRGDDAARAAALTLVRSLHRPVAIVLETGRHAALRDWLVRSGSGALLWQDQDTILWTIP